MRWSRAFIPTLHDDPADAEAASHRLLTRGGFIRQLMAGSYSLLPLGQKVAAKIEGIIREEMDAIGAQEFVLPVVHPAEAWRKTGRYDDVEGILVKFQDRKGADLLLAMTHEEIFALLATEMKSYREVPQTWYQFQTKFRDEARPKSGLLRVREFTMKDSYSFDIDVAGLDAQFDAHRGAYERIFARFGLDAMAVEASSGAMGGSDSAEFMTASPAGEDDVVVCPTGDYAANVERAESMLPEVVDQPWEGAPERVATPGIRTIAALEEAFEFAGGDRQIKTLVYIVESEPVLVLMRGDHELQEQKLVDALGTGLVRPADRDEIRPLLGADPGSLGAVGVSGPKIVADPALRGRTNLVTGANEDDWHLRGVDIERDIAVDEWIDLRLVKAGEPCPRCGSALEIKRMIEIGHIFKLGTIYSEALGATLLDVEGESLPIQMGSYGIGVGRGMAAIVETHHDDKGITWPMSVAPYEVVITVVKVDDEASVRAGDAVYEALQAKGIDILLDDRQERPGVKFNDAELIGIPLRITIGPRGLANDEVELTTRATGETEAISLEEIADVVVGRVSVAKADGIKY